MFKTGTKSAHKIQSYGFLKMDRNDARLLKAWSTYFPIEIDFLCFISRVTFTNILRFTRSLNYFIEIDRALRMFQTGRQSAQKIKRYESLKMDRNDAKTFFFTRNFVNAEIPRRVFFKTRNPRQRGRSFTHESIRRTWRYLI